MTTAFLVQRFDTIFRFSDHLLGRNKKNLSNIRQTCDVLPLKNFILIKVECEMVLDTGGENNSKAVLKKNSKVVIFDTNVIFFFMSECFRSRNKLTDNKCMSFLFNFMYFARHF